MVAALCAAGCAIAPAIVGPTAPPECGFPAGTPLSFGGRSTTANLGVQEVVGDPLSHEPADIYVTRDEVDQGALRGRLVCAIYVNQADFVEITVVPEALRGEGGNTEEPDAKQTGASPAKPPGDGLSTDEAVSAARKAVPKTWDWEVAVVEAGPIREIVPDYVPSDWAHELEPDRWVWRVMFVSGYEGSEVFVDFEDGSLLGVMDWIS